MDQLLTKKVFRYTSNYTKEVTKIVQEKFPQYEIDEKKCRQIFKLFLGTLTSAMIQQRWIRIDGYIKFYYLPGQLLRKLRNNLNKKS